MGILFRSSEVTKYRDLITDLVGFFDDLGGRFDLITASSPGPRRGAGHGTGAALSTDREEEETGQEEAEQNKIKSGVKSWR